MVIIEHNNSRKRARSGRNRARNGHDIMNMASKGNNRARNCKDRA